MQCKQSLAFKAQALCRPMKQEQDCFSERTYAYLRAAAELPWCPLDHCLSQTVLLPPYMYVL